MATPPAGLEGRIIEYMLDGVHDVSRALTSLRSVSSNPAKGLDTLAEAIKMNIRVTPDAVCRRAQLTRLVENPNEIWIQSPPPYHPKFNRELFHRAMKWVGAAHTVRAAGENFIYQLAVSPDGPKEFAGLGHFFVDEQFQRIAPDCDEEMIELVETRGFPMSYTTVATAKHIYDGASTCLRIDIFDVSATVSTGFGSSEEQNQNIFDNLPLQCRDLIKSHSEDVRFVVVGRERVLMVLVRSEYSKKFGSIFATDILKEQVISYVCDMLSSNRDFRIPYENTFFEKQINGWSHLNIYLSQNPFADKGAIIGTATFLPDGKFNKSASNRFYH